MDGVTHSSPGAGRVPGLLVNRGKVCKNQGIQSKASRHFSALVWTKVDAPGNLSEDRRDSWWSTGGSRQLESCGQDLEHSKTSRSQPGIISRAGGDEHREPPICRNSNTTAVGSRQPECSSRTEGQKTKL